MADERTDNPSSGEKFVYTISSRPRTRYYFDTFDLGASFDVDVFPARHRHGLGEPCPACEKLHEVEFNLAKHGPHGEILYRSDALEGLRRIARHLIDEEYERGSLLKLSTRTLVGRKLASPAGIDAAAEEEGRDEPAEDDERLAEIRAALEKSRELGERAQSGIDALASRSH